MEDPGEQRSGPLIFENDRTGAAAEPQAFGGLVEKVAQAIRPMGVNENSDAGVEETWGLRPPDVEEVVAVLEHAV